MLPGRKGSEGRPAKDNRLFVEAVLYRYRAGIPWRGVWKDVFAALATEADNEYAMIDSTIVRAHPHSAGALKKGAIKPSASAGAVAAPRSM